jgi:hypothetical protein
VKVLPPISIDMSFPSARTAIASAWAVIAEAAKASELVVLTTSPPSKIVVPVMAVPGETLTSPPWIVLPAAKVIAVRAWTA